jgi:hypothetical protein
VEKSQLTEKLASVQEQLDKEHMQFLVYRCHDLDDMIAVLRPLTDAKAQGFKLSSKSISTSEAQAKLRALE